VTLFFFFFSKVYPLFIPRKNVCTGGEETSLTESGSSNFGVDSVDSVKKPSFDSKRSNSFSFSGASSHSMERHQYLQRGISLLKTSVTAITTYYYNSLGLEVPSNLSTFEAFAKLLHMLSSSKALRTALESNIASRYLLFHSMTCISVIQYRKGFKKTDPACCFQVRKASAAAKQIDVEGKFGHIIRQQFYGQHAHSRHGKFLFRSYIACKLQFPF
jgi:hypothetical protein